jgi:hypothetical protein
MTPDIATEQFKFTAIGVTDTGYATTQTRGSRTGRHSGLNAAQ